MTTRRIDQILLTLGVALILMSAYQLFFVSRDGSAGLKNLGTLSLTEAVVKSKGALSLDWRDAFVGSDVTENQLLYTDERASAEVQFTQGGKLSLGENSLIRLKSKNVSVERGFLRAKLEGKNPLVVEMNGKEYRLSGKSADVQINLAGNSGEIGVLSGEVKVDQAGKSQTIDSKSALVIEGDQINKKAVVFKLLSPAYQELISTSLTQAPVTFKWEPQSEAQVIVSSNREFKKARTFSGSGEVMAELGEGIHYWKVESREGRSLSGQFQVLIERPLSLIRPLDGEKISLIKPELLFQWKGTGLAKYLLEWQDTETHTQITSGTSFVVPLTASGPVKWRVKIEDPRRPEAVWTEWQNITVDVVPPPQIPTDLSPDGIEFQIYKSTGETVEMSWKSEGEVDWEMISPNGKKETKRVATSFLQTNVALAGVYKWHVRSVDKHLRMSEWGAWKTFEVTDLSKERIEGGIQRIQLKRPDQSVNFEWEAGEGATSVFELSRDQNFKEVVSKQEVRTKNAKVIVPKVGTYYWRSRQFSADGSVQVSEPRKVIIEPAPGPSKPQKPSDLEVPIEWKVIEGKTTFWDFFISSAYADELKGVVRIKVPSHEDAKGYVIRIYRDENLTELVLEKNLSRTDFEWMDATPGQYYWQYAIIDHWDRKSPFSDASILNVLASDRPSVVKPKLLSPIRAVEIDQGEVTLNWTADSSNSSYEVQVSREDDFKDVLWKQDTKKSSVSVKEELAPGLHYWRVIAKNKWGEEVTSNTGRFVMKERPPLERTTIIDYGWEKKFGHRLSLAFAPSLDSYSFKSNSQTGKISGNAINSLEVKGDFFFNKWILGAEVLRQSGKVFKSQDYLFQRILLEVMKRKDLSFRHTLGYGVAVGTTSGMSYDITTTAVTSKSVSGANYGLVVKDFFAFNEKWGLQSKAMYLLGEIKQLEIGSEITKQLEKYYVMGGLTFSQRDYKLNSGKQTSIRISVGLGKEF